MSTFILNLCNTFLRQSWRYEIFIFLTQLKNWQKIDKLFMLGTQGAGYLHDIGNTTMIIRFLHADFEHQLTNRQNQELTGQLDHLSDLIIQGQSLLTEQQLTSKHFCAHACIHHCVHLFKNHPLGKNCTIQIKGKKHCELFGPSLLLTQATFNILQNSSQATQGQKNKKITIHLKKENKTVIITIEDNGPGFPRGFKVQPFASTKVDGHGIGLWHSLLQLKKHFACTYSCSNAAAGGAQTILYFWNQQ